MSLRRHSGELPDGDLDRITRVVYTVGDFTYISERHEPWMRYMPWQMSKPFARRFQKQLVVTKSEHIPSAEEIIIERHSAWFRVQGGKEEFEAEVVPCSPPPLMEELRGHAEEFQTNLKW